MMKSLKIFWHSLIKLNKKKHSPGRTPKTHKICDDELVQQARDTTHTWAEARETRKRRIWDIGNYRGIYCYLKVHHLYRLRCVWTSWNMAVREMAHMDGSRESCKMRWWWRVKRKGGRKKRWKKVTNEDISMLECFAFISARRRCWFFIFIPSCFSSLLSEAFGPMMMGDNVCGIKSSTKLTESEYKKPLKHTEKRMKCHLTNFMNLCSALLCALLLFCAAAPLSRCSRWKK